MAYLEINNLYKNFGNTEVLKGVSLSVEQGEILSVIGQSGSGKTTLLRCLNFLETADKGQILLNGETLFSRDGEDEKTKKREKKKKENNLEREKRLNFGLVFQNYNLFPQYTVMQNCTLAPLAFLKEKYGDFASSSKERIYADCENVLKKIGLINKKDSYPCELSGGQCQRAAIARALALHPKVLCFDEPTAALDPALTDTVLNLIRSLKEDGRTIIIVTHDMDFAKNVSDKIAFVCDGKILENGSPEQIFSNPQTTELKQFLSSGAETEAEL